MPRSPISQASMCADSGTCVQKSHCMSLSTQVVGQPALLRADEVLELHRVPDEEDRDVVPDDVQVALDGVEPQREAARVAPGVGAAPLPGHRGEPDQRVGPGAGLEHRRLGVGTDVVGHLEVAERAAALGVRLALRDALPVEVRHLLDQIVILQQDRTVRADGERDARHSRPGYRRPSSWDGAACWSYRVSPCSALRGSALRGTRGFQRDVTGRTLITSRLPEERLDDFDAEIGYVLTGR